MYKDVREIVWTTYPDRGGKIYMFASIGGVEIGTVRTVKEGVYLGFARYQTEHRFCNGLKSPEEAKTWVEGELRLFLNTLLTPVEESTA